MMLFNNMNSLEIKNCVFDPLLSRGLDYYTGIIYEAIYKDHDIMPSTIAAGGRYNNMLDKLGTRGQINAIGVSIGIDRIITILETNIKEMPKILHTNLVYVATVGKNLEIHKLKLIDELRKQNINVEFSYNPTAKMRQQLDYVFKNNIKYMIVFGENELISNTLKLKNILEHTEVTIKRNEISNFLC